MRRPVNTASQTSVLSSTSQFIVKEANDDVILNELNEIYNLIVPPNKFLQVDTQTTSRKIKTEPSKREDVMITLKRY